MAVSNGLILLVDDNAALVDNLAEVLGDAGYETSSARSCAEARKCATAFDVALVDVRLPDGDGTELARTLKERAPDSQVILLTGYASTASAAAAVRAGAFAYLVKPVPPADLLLTVEQAVRQVRLTMESRELQRRAQRAEKLAAVGTLAAGLSHEIKNPLNAAALQLTVLERRLRRMAGANEDVFQPLAIVQEEIKRLASFLDDFLQFMRPRELTRATMDPAHLIIGVLDLLQPQATEARLRLDPRVDPLPAILADEARLKQVLINLVLNAIQATPPGGWVRVDGHSVDNKIVLTVEDSGPGIPDHVRDRLFEPFFTTKESGTGLGLPMIHSIVEQHHGSITVERGDVGGARFVIGLPLA
jgi:signal transduction histidine kinase